MMSSRRDRRLYGGSDPAEVPAYPISEAAQFLWVQQKALRRWATGESGRKAVIRIADPRGLLLSFLNLAELHVLSFLRDQQVPLRNIRRAVDWLSHEVGADHPHPLLAMDLATDGVSVFVTELTGEDAIVNISKHGQLAMTELIRAHLRRLDLDERTKTVLRLYPFPWKVRSAAEADQQPKPISIDPRIAFGRPVLTGTRVPTAEIADRISVGEPIASIAEDMRLDTTQVEAALRYHVKAA